MFFWTTPKARYEITHGIGYNQKSVHTCKHFISSSIYIIRVIMIITLFLPISNSYYHHKTSRVEEQEDFRPQNIYYGSMQSPLLRGKLGFRHHKQGKKNSDLFATIQKRNENDQIWDIASANTRNQFQFKHHSGAEVKNERLSKNFEEALKILNTNLKKYPTFREGKNSQTSEANDETLNRIPKRNEDDENLLQLANERTKNRISQAEDPNVPTLVLRGETAIIPCLQTSMGTAPTGTVSWWYGHSQPVTDGRFSVSKTGSLVLQDAQAHDSDKYYCKLSEDDTSFEHILQVYLPKEQTYRIYWQYSTPEPCDDTRLPKLKSALHEIFLKQVCAERCTATDLRLSCQFSTDTSNYLDVTLYMTGTLDKSVLAKCVTKECMEKEMKRSACEGILRLIALITPNLRCSEDGTQTHYVKKSLHVSPRPSCAAGYGLTADKCMPCQPGSYSSPGATECIDCRPGFYQSEYGARACFACESGSSPPGSTSKYNCGSKMFTQLTSNNLRLTIPLLIILILSVGFIVATARWLKNLTHCHFPFG